MLYLSYILIKLEKVKNIFSWHYKCKSIDAALKNNWKYLQMYKMDWKIKVIDGFQETLFFYLYVLNNFIKF